MAFPIPLACKMSGATRSQLAYWRKTAVLVPEVESSEAPYLYSFRDVVALRSFAWLRDTHSLQQIRASLDHLRELDLYDHPSAYKLVKLGASIGIVLDSGAGVDISRHPGQLILTDLETVFAEFQTRGKKVDALFHPRAGVEVNPHRLGGWPTIAGTRIPFDTVASVVSDGTISADDIGYYFPAVTPEAARDALDYQQSIEAEAA